MREIIFPGAFNTCMLVVKVLNSRKCRKWEISVSQITVPGRQEVNFDSRRLAPKVGVLAT